jgi:hypothetical protein
LKWRTGMQILSKRGDRRDGEVGMAVKSSDVFQSIHRVERRPTSQEQQ